LAVKKFGEKTAAKDWQKTLANVDLHHQLLINNMKPNEAIPNIDEYNKMNSVFSRICLVPHASSVLFDDDEVHCRVYDLWLSQIYKQTVA